MTFPSSTTDRSIVKPFGGVLRGTDLVEELQRVFAGGSAGVDRPRLNPAIPLLNNQNSCFTLFHRRVFPSHGKAVGS